MGKALQVSEETAELKFLHFPLCLLRTLNDFSQALKPFFFHCFALFKEINHLAQPIQICPLNLGFFIFSLSNILEFNRIVYWVLSQENEILGRLPVVITSYLWWLPQLRRMTQMILCQSWQASISSNVVMRLLWIHKLVFTSLCSLLVFESISFLPSFPPLSSPLYVR